MTSFDLPRAGEIHLDWMVLGFAAAVLSIATGVLFGLAPSLTRPSPISSACCVPAVTPVIQALKRGEFSGLNVRGLLLIGQMALSMVLLIGAALLIESVSNLRGIDVGFNPSHLLTMQVPLPPLRYDTNQKRATFFRGSRPAGAIVAGCPRRHRGDVPPDEGLCGNARPGCRETAAAVEPAP